MERMHQPCGVGHVRVALAQAGDRRRVVDEVDDGAARELVGDREVRDDAGDNLDLAYQEDIPDDALCITPGCTQMANRAGGFRTCCRYCPMTHTHSYECNHRNGIMLRTRHDEEGVPVFPEGAAPQFSEPYQQVRQSLRVAVNRLQEEFANRENGRPPQRTLIIPAEVGTLPRGRVYHFFDGCHNMRRARIEDGGRILRECQI